MRDRILLLLLALFTITVVLGCPPQRRGGGDDDDDDDDDSSSDDDDSTPPADDDDDDDDDDTLPPTDDDDDDDDSTPPPSFAPNQVSFGALFDVTCVSGPVCDLEATLQVRYWIDQASGQLLCEQHLEGSGTITLGYETVSDCPNCTGQYALGSFVDVTNPAADPDHCDMPDVDFAELNYGEVFVTSPPDGFGDFAQGVFMNAGTHDSLGTDYSDNGTLNHDDLVPQYEEFGLTYAGLIFWDSGISGSAAEGLDSAGLFSAEGDSGQYQPALIVYFNSEANTDADPDSDSGFQGEHGALGTFLYNLN